MHNKLWLWLLAGWLIAAVFPPSHVIGMFKSKG